MQIQNREVLRELKEGGVQMLLISEVSGTAGAESETQAKSHLKAIRAQFYFY